MQVMKPSLVRKPSVAMNHGDDARAEELGHLKLALATFALQLDAFEMRTHSLLAVGKPGNLVPPPDRGGGSRKDDLSDGQ
jgi:hypothetical protein